MSLQFILGGSGSGKSACLYDQVISRSLEDPHADIILLVPEQYTMLSQRHLVMQHPRHSVLNVDVLSFERLAYRIFEETGTDSLKILDDTGKSMILRRILSQNKDRLQVYGGNVRKRGFVDQVKSMLSELLQYGVDPDMLMEKAADLQGDDRLFAKLRDIGLIYSEFLRFLGSRYMTTEQVLDRLCSVIGRSERIRHAVIFMDNFTGFTPVQYKLMEHLLSLCPEIVMTLCTDTGNLPQRLEAPDKDELFYITRETIYRLEQICVRWRIDRKEDILLDGKAAPRFAGRSDLAALQANLYRTWITPYHEPTEAISLSRAANPGMEMRLIAARIHHLISKEGLRYSEIAVIASDMEVYQGSARYWFSVYGIPCFFDARRAVSSGMAAEWIRSLLDMIAGGYSGDRVFRFLRSGLSDLEREEIDLLENYVLAMGIRGFRRGNSVWTARNHGISEEDLLRLNQIRERFIEPLAELTAMASDQELTFGKLVRALYGYMTAADLEGKIRGWQAYFAAEGDLAREKEYDQIYDLLIDLLEKIFLILGEEKATIREFADILEAGLRQVKLAIIPPALDQVTFGDTQRTRLDDVKVLFFAGLSDDLVPRVDSAAGMITDRDREELARIGLTLAPTAREQLCTQRYYIYAAMTKPSGKLILSRSIRDASGTPLLPASLLAHLGKIFPALEETAYLSDEDLMQYPDVHQAWRYLIRGYRKPHAGEETNALWENIYRWFSDRPERAGQMQALEQAASFRYRGERLSDAAVAAVYGGRLTGGVTMLEQYARCAYAHFLAYGLGLRERDVYEVGAPDIGTIFHKAIELFSRRVSAGGSSWREIGDDARDKMAKACVEEAVSDYRSNIMKDSCRAAYITEKITRMTQRTVRVLQQQIQKGDFEPVGYEVKFEAGMDSEALHLQTEGGLVSLRGKVDRLDILEEDGKKYLRIIDYKTGSTKFDLASIFHGLQLQLVVYMNAVCEKEREKQEQVQVIPAGIFYYNIDDPVIEAECFDAIRPGEEADEAVQLAIMDGLAMDGLSIGDDDVIRRMDRNPEEKPNVLNLKLKGGLVQESDHLASLDDFLLLSDYVREKTEEIGKAIFEGRISAIPYKEGSNSACKYCPYRAVCGFDEGMPGYRFKRLKKIKDKKEIWKYLAERRSTNGSDMDTAAAGSDTVEEL